MLLRRTLLPDTISDAMMMGMVRVSTKYDTLFFTERQIDQKLFVVTLKTIN